MDAIDWESMWAPYDDETYQYVLAQVSADDVVVDIGAGDLRPARQLAPMVRRVYAVERDRELVSRVLPSLKLCHNLVVVNADALFWQLPEDITLAVLLMRHCTRDHFATCARRLKQAGCRRLVTNARWKMGVEVIDLAHNRRCDPDRAGWYACHCGAVGFTAPDFASITEHAVNDIADVVLCPECMSQVGSDIW
ncbi:MAG: rRNA adenine N-6-methyltransferase family protein [Roseiflexus sp.]